jgi:hypothetical protein
VVGSYLVNNGSLLVIDILPLLKLWGACKLDTSGSLINIPDRPGVLGIRAKRTKCWVWTVWGEDTVIFALGRWPKFGGN